MNNLIEFSNVSLGYGNKIILKNLDFIIKEKTFLGLVGPNGAGKTTILKSILGILKPLKGSIQLNQKLHIGYVPQRELADEIFPFTVLEVVLMGRYSLIPLLRRPGKKDKEEALKSLEYLGIKELSNKPYRDLSGGQKQRVLIARALCGSPDLLVLDEPTNGMDLSGEKNIMDIVLKLHREKDLTIIFVTHILNLMANYSKEIILLENSSYKFGDTDKILKDEILSNLYSMKVTVGNLSGQTVIVTGEN